MTTGHRNICIINGHPHDGPHFVTALADAYEAGAQETGYETTRIDVGKMDIMPLRNPLEFEASPTDAAILESQKLIEDAEHVVFLFPMWLGGVPAHTRAFIEHLARGSFFLDQPEDDGQWPRQMMKGKSIRIVMTMGMPAMAYRLLFGAHTIRGVEKNIFGISGFNPIHHTLIGMVEGMEDQGRQHWLERLRQMGRNCK